MSWRCAVLALLVASACGRVDFGSPLDGGVAPDAVPDGTTFDDICKRDGVTVCETFEGNTATNWDFTGAPLPVVTPTLSYGTGHSLLSVGGAQMQSSYLTSRLIDPIPTPSFYSRAWVYLPSADTIGHVNLITLDSDMGGYSLVAIDDDPGTGPEPVIELYTDAKIGPMDIGTAPRDRWFCVELQVDLADPNGHVKGTVDSGGPMERSTQNSGRTTLPPLKYLYLGASFSGPNQAADLHVYIDDFLLGRDPVGCYP
ncbi:MAG TPA: hypothetical protein VGM39_25625 [Kofleriaceae bacterium]